MARSARSRAFAIPADVANAPPVAQHKPRSPTVAAVTLELTAHEPADLLAALIAGMAAARTEAATHAAKGDNVRAEQATARAARLEALLARCASTFADHWGSAQTK